ncbi:MAG: hypothetical protein EON55_03895 [Alphaproteobacteria bacterium]|nr:MAG: hypothetical protein EON55_03895 [Alphaproteobacteria bacterium]
MQVVESDHFFHRGLNRPEHGWLICKGCHDELTLGGYLVRFSRTAEFRRFQRSVIDVRKRMAGRTGIQPSSAGPTAV